MTGFSLVGGPAYNDSAAAVSVLKELNLPYVAAHHICAQPFLGASFEEMVRRGAIGGNHVIGLRSSNKSFPSIIRFIICVLHRT